MDRRILAGAALGAATLFTSDLASASGFLVARFGGEHGHPMTENPTALYYNPAGLALGKGTRIYLDGSFALRMASYDRPVEAIDNVAGNDVGPGTPQDALAANSGEATLTNFVASPFAGVVTDFGVDNLGVGLGLYFPFGGQAVWDDNADFEGNAKYPGAVGGVQRWWSMDGTIRSMYVTAGGAYKIEPANLSIGAGLNLVRTEVVTLRARNSDGSDDMVTADGGLQEGRSLVDASGMHLAASAGLIWEPAEHVKVGVSYQSQPNFGEMTLEGTLDATLGSAPVGEPSDIEFVQSLPDVIRAGVSFMPADKISVRVFGEYVRWSVFEYQCLLDKADDKRACKFEEDGTIASDGSGVIQNVPRNWEDSFGARVGGSYHFPGMELYLGAGYDGNAVPDDTLDPALMDMEKLSFSGGGRFRLTDGLFLAPTLTQVVYFEREIEPTSRDATGRREGFQPPSRAPDIAGTYSQSITLLNLNVEYGF